MCSLASSTSSNINSNINISPSSSSSSSSSQRQQHAGVVSGRLLIPTQPYIADLGSISGTINVLTAAKAVGVRRVVVTSSVSAITQKELWYPLSKTLAEKAAWDFSRESDLDVVVVNPGIVMGPVIPPTIKATMVMLVRLLQGCTETYENFFMGSIHFKDVALAHICM